MAQRTKRILILDDDFESMYDLKEHLEETKGWEVDLTAASDLLERLRRERFDLILLDSMIRTRSAPLPTMRDEEEVTNIHFKDVSWLKTGLEFLRRLRRGDFFDESAAGTPPDVPVVVISAAADYSIERELGGEIPIQGYFKKPFRLEKVMERICELLEE